MQLSFRELNFPPTCLRIWRMFGVINGNRVEVRMLNLLSGINFRIPSSMISFPKS